MYSHASSTNHSPQRKKHSKNRLRQPAPHSRRGLIPHSAETPSVSSESLLQGQDIASVSGKSGVLVMARNVVRR